MTPDEFAEYQNKVAQQYLKSTVKGPNEEDLGLAFTYGDLISDRTENILARSAVLKNPKVRKRAEEHYSPEVIDRAIAQWETYKEENVTPYISRNFVSYGPENFPSYAAELERRKSPDYPTELKEEQQTFPYASGTFSDDIVMSPWFFEEGKEVASYGVNPMPEAQADLPENLRDDIALNPRRMTKENFEFLAKKYNLKGKLKYVNPNKPNLGITYTNENGVEKIVNSTFITGTDWENFLRQEGPSLMADIALTIGGTKKLDKSIKGMKFLGVKGLEALKKIDPKWLERSLKVGGMGALSATGATSGDLLRLLIGKGTGANDLSPEQMLKESLMIGTLSFLGTAAVSTFTLAFPKLWYNFTGQDIPTSFYARMEDVTETIKRQEAGLPSGVGGTEVDFLYGDPTTVKQIQETIDELSSQVVQEIGEWRPTIASLTGDIDAATLEAVFLKNASDTTYGAFYEQLKQGNRQVIEQLFRAINEKAGGTTTAATSAGLGQQFRVFATEKIESLDRAAREAIANMQKAWKIQVDEVDAGGTNLLREVPPKEELLFTGPDVRLKQIKDDYLKPFNDKWNNTFKKYGDLIGGGGYIKTPTNIWKKGIQRDADNLVKSLDSPEAAVAFKTVFGAEGGAVMKRFQMLGKQGFENPKFTMKEMNQARVVLNEIIGNTDNKQIIRYATNLMTGIKKQMQATLDDGARIEMKNANISPLGKGKNAGDYTPKQINSYKQETGYGLDLNKAWQNQKTAIKESGTRLINELLQKEPERVLPYILETNTKGSRINTQMSRLVKVLKEKGSGELNGLRKSFAGYIQDNFINVADETPQQIARNYREFMKEYRGTINELFEGGWSSFSFNPKQFEKYVVKELDDYVIRQNAIKARFGLADNPDPNPTDIIYSFLNSSKTQKQTGQLMFDMEELLGLAKGNKLMEEELANVTRRWITQEVTAPKQGLDNVVTYDPTAINRLLTEGFGPQDITGPALTFDNFILPLLGKEGKEYLKNLKVWNALVQREVGADIAEKSVQKYLNMSTESSTEYLKKAVIPPLTQFGRRVTAFEKRLNEKSQEFIAEMLLNPDLFKRTLAAVKGRQNMSTFIRFLSSYGTVATADMGEELSLYDPNKKKQSTREKSVFEIPAKIPGRVLEIGEETIGLGAP
tara:strand:+ start:1029 stop:4475 length:3447 start_codon:yes stop_codon:yes gene_type:complete